MKKNMKKCLVVSMSCAILMSNSVYAYDKKSVTISVNNVIQPTVSSIINKEDYTLVGFRDLFSMVGASVEWDSKKRDIIARKYDKILTINIDTNNVKLNDKYLEMPVGVEIVDNYTYVPLRFVCEAFGLKVDWNSEKQKIFIETNEEDYQVLNLEEEKQKKEKIDINVKEMTFDEAFKIAKSKNSSLKNLDDNISYTKDVVYNLNKSIEDENIFDPAIEQILRNINALNSQVEDKEINEKLIEDGIKLSLITSINSIKVTKLNIDFLEKSIELEEKNRDALDLKYNYGLVAENDTQKVRDSILDKKRNLENLKSTLETQQIALNNLLGESKDVNVKVNFDDNIKVMDKIDFEAYVTRAKEGDLSIQLLKKNLKRAEEKRRNYSHTSNDEDKTKGDNDINVASRRLSDGQIDIENKLRNSYDNLLKIQARDKSLKAEKEQAKEEYNKVYTNYTSGNATKNQVEAAKLAILNIEKQIEENKMSYALALYTFERPYLSSNFAIE